MSESPIYLCITPRSVTPQPSNPHKLKKFDVKLPTIKYLQSFTKIITISKPKFHFVPLNLTPPNRIPMPLPILLSNKHKRKPLRLAKKSFIQYHFQ